MSRPLIVFFMLAFLKSLFRPCRQLLWLHLIGSTSSLAPTQICKQVLCENLVHAWVIEKLIERKHGVGSDQFGGFQFF